MVSRRADAITLVFSARAVVDAVGACHAVHATSDRDSHRVISYGGVRDRQGATTQDAPALAAEWALCRVLTGRVVGDGGVGDRQRALVVDAAAVPRVAELLPMVELVTVSVPRR